MPKKIIRTALKKVLAKFKNGTHMSNMNSTNGTIPISAAGNITTTIAAQGNYTTGYNISNWNLTGISNIGNYTISNSSAPSIISINNSAGNELVRINKDGSVTWSDNVTVDEAAEALGKSLQVGAELSAGITYRVKQNMRDAVFEEMISLAKEKGSLTAEDLTYLHTAAKIMDKLKGKE